MICAKCLRKLSKPGAEITIHGRALMLGPVCAARLMGKPKRKASTARTRVRRVEQADLFGVVA